MSGCPYQQGRPGDGKTQSATLVFVVGGVDLQRMPDYLTVRKIWQSKPRPVPIDHSVFQFVPHGDKSNEIAVNMTHILNCDCTKSADLARIRREAVQQAEYLLLEFFHKEVPGYEKAWISHYAPQIGCRETRRITGDYILTEDDVINSRRFADEIACGIWGINVHNPDGIHTRISRVIERPYGIPYRCVTPQNIDNLYVVGRAISADHIALSSARINATCMALCEAVGWAASEGIACGSTHQVNVKQLKAKIAQAHYRCFEY